MDTMLLRNTFQLRAYQLWIILTDYLLLWQADQQNIVRQKKNIIDPIASNHIHIPTGNLHTGCIIDAQAEVRGDEPNSAAVIHGDMRTIASQCVVHKQSVVPGEIFVLVGCNASISP